MKFRAEIVVEEVLPTIRVLLARALGEEGLTQRAVAEKLGLSQSAVSKYAQGEVHTNEAIEADGRVRSMVEDLARGLATGDMRPVQALIEIETLLQTLSGPGEPVAELHAAAVPELSSLSYDLAGVPEAARERERVRASVRRGLRLLETSSGVATLIPHVGSNLVACPPDSEGPEDVAGVPGRIREVNGRVDVPAEPAFGASEYVGGVLLAAREAGSTARAGVNLAYSEPVLEALSEQVGDPIGLDIESQSVQAAVSEAVRADPDVRVLYHRGAVGLEPIVYLLGQSASTLARTTREVAATLTGTGR